MNKEMRTLTEKRGDGWRWYVLSNYKTTGAGLSAVLKHGSAATEAEAEARAGRALAELLKNY